MIAAISWVPKGVAKAVPAEAEPPSNEEIEELLKSGLLDKREDSDDKEAEDDMNVDESKENEDDEVAHALVAADALGKATQVASVGTDDITDGLKELDMDNYDEEEDGIELFGSGLKDVYYASNDMDPYLKDKDNDSEDDDDMIIRPDDSVIVYATNEDDVSQLEIMIVEDLSDGEISMYVYHALIIPAFPLCTAWLDCPIKGGERGNFIAVGSMEPAIEIWDIDIIDEVQPSVILGGIDEIKKKGKKKSIKYKKDSHTDAVLGLSWNKEYRNILASASADHSVKVWDVTTEACNLTMNDHTDKVQAVAWNPFAPQILLSGSFDHTVCLKDGRKPSHSGYKFSVGADVESLAWDPHSEHSFVASLENGTVSSFDIRAASSDSTSETKPSFTIHAHDKAASSVSFNPLVPNLLATGSTDKTVKLWDLTNNQPSRVTSKNPKAGAVFSVSFSDDCPFLLAIGGSKGNLQLWDISSEDSVLKKYGKYAAQKKASPNS
ncbi:periodic tryptophan protein 1 isoform X1 [Capsicum galapagoense]